MNKNLIIFLALNFFAFDIFTLPNFVKGNAYNEYCKEEIAKMKIESELNECLIKNKDGELNNYDMPLACENLISQFLVVCGAEKLKDKAKAFKMVV